MSDFPGLLHSYYQAWFRFHPETAVDLGVRGFESQLTPFADDDIGALNTLNEKLIDSLDEIETSRLTAAQVVDRDVMYGAAVIELSETIEHDWRYCDPARYLPVHAIYQLTLHNLKLNKQHLKTRLEAIPRYLRNAQANLHNEPEAIPPLWLEAAHTEAVQGAEYLRSLRKHPIFLQHALNSELEQAAHAVDEFARFMETALQPHAAGDFACGKTRFERLLQHRHALPVSAEQLHALGERLFEETLAALKQVTFELQGNDDIQQLTDRIQARHPTAEQLQETYRENMLAAKAFVEQQDLISLPEPESLRVIETPPFLRHEIPFAAYLEPPFNDPEQQGYYYVTPVENAASLGEHNFVSLQHTCVHEAWPGHHLQFVTANRGRRSSSLPRLVNPSSTLYEGWALYCEQLMQEQGFLDSPESRFILLKDRLWRALRIMLDVELHTRGLPVERAAERMQHWLGFTRAQAMADLGWYTRSPTVPMGYATGWALINATRERLRQLEKPFHLKSFHDRLLAEGSIALSHGIREQFGHPVWESVQRDVFARRESDSAASI
ncbi:DUF885 domain-containing protein [Thiohalophilus thiocyanatoxydans]|uniref:Uncharacterized protein (DUF885 family) n=1 Tax=Thiohalophilus thiocyanatoxydans TaxID=381308 RepID=A0A4R8IXG9_9GAMM|nr:DUF885 domain-containing protein [Thiohalophilus thiocyanatoxydans]TDY04260.1 uncharacterized protein (DUF885 family) [Thiohalophilus thiocyanatoxydans]